MLVALHAIKETILGFYRVKKECKKLVDTVKYIAQSSTKSVFCVYSNADCTTQPRKFFRTLTQVGCSYNKCNIALG